MPAGEDRSYSGNAVPTTLTASITNVATTIPIAASTGWPDGTGGPFFIYIDSEVIKCSSRSGLTLNVQTSPVTGRGWDNTTAASHTIGATVQHVFTATDAEELNEHVSDTTLDHHTQYLTVARHDLTTRHGFGILPTAGTPSTSLVGDTASGGTGNNVAKIDHKHAREGFGAPTASAVGDASANGVATSVSRSDHKHAREAFAGTGSATTPARSDHTHTITVIPSYETLNEDAVGREGDITVATGNSTTLHTISAATPTGAAQALIQIYFTGQVRAATSSAGEVQILVDGGVQKYFRWHTHGAVNIPIRFYIDKFWAVWSGYDPVLTAVGTVDGSAGSAEFSMTNFGYQFVLYTGV